MTPIGTSARARLAAFVRSLRANGFATGLGETQDALKIMTSELALRPVYLREGFKALFCSRQQDWQRFDEIFDAFWLGRGMKTAVRASGAKPDARSEQRSGFSGVGAPADSTTAMADRNAQDDAGDLPGEGRSRGASSTENLSQTDLRHIAEPEALDEALQLAERLARVMRDRLTRRDRRHRRGRRIDMRRTIRASIGQGGTPVDLVRRRRKEKPLRLVMLLDVSGSMSLYSTAFVRFMRGLVDRAHEAEAYVFHTRLVHISEALRESDPVRAVERLSLMAQGWSGGTRIGDSLASFNRFHAARVLNSRSVVIILSDGYDTGEPGALAQEMAALRRRARRIVWLNPMMGWKDYAPVAGGMRAALPYIDLFAPAHNLASLAALEPYLAKL
ncbi:vWA domain-containing protein [Hypericibacter sp.]|uniref:vWA domain-containing protein n=1 Tax=Hypericibacter sp. TaxID=2705401 RepID=UPI003D6D7455